MENVNVEQRNNFDKYSSDKITDFGVGYDFQSVMHYPGSAFSKNGEKTMAPKKKVRYLFIS